MAGGYLESLETWVHLRHCFSFNFHCGGLYPALSNPLLSKIHTGIYQQKRVFQCTRNNIESDFGPAQFITQLTHVLSVMEAVDASAILDFITH